MEKVNNIYDDFDEILDKHIKDNKVNFMEINTALMLVKKKMSYEETSSWLQFMIAGIQEEHTNGSTETQSESSETQNKPSGDMYG